MKSARNWGRLGMKFNRYTLSDLATIKYGKNQKKVLSDDGNVPIFGTGGLMGFATTSLYDKPSVLIGRKGTIGKVKFVEQPFWTVDTLFYTIINTDIVIPKYLFYVMSLMDLNNYNEGTTIPSLRTETLNRLEFDIPDLEEQRKVLSCLNPIDEKIELNNAINNNLEQQMQTLFKEFLSSNESGKLTTVEKVVLTANTGADAIQKAPIVDYDTGIRCIRVGDMTNSRSFYEWGFTKVTDKVFKRYQLHKDDIVVTRTASLGLNTIISEDLSAVYNNGLIRLTVDTSRMLPLYLYRQFQTEDFENYITRIESETSVRPNMKINYLLKYEFVLPSISKQSELIELLTPMLNKQNSLVSENKQLESLRDTLLPKLMSGELDVSGIDLEAAKLLFNIEGENKNEI